MDTTVGFVFSAVFLFVSLLLATNTVQRTRVLLPWQPVILLLTLIWWVTPLVKKAFIDDVFYPTDSLLHEEIAREIAYLIGQCDWREVSEYLGFGNEGYRVLLGGFYALTDAPELTTYGIHGLLGLWGMLTVLELACFHSDARRVPLWVVLLCIASPSVIFWTTFNLKEGAMLWGLCMMCRFSFVGTKRNESLLMPILGLMVAGFLRPHITIAYLFALGFGLALQRRQIGMAVVATCGIGIALLMLKTIAPVMFDQLTHDGINATLNDKFQEMTTGEGSVITYARGQPIPVISGFILLNLRPFPWEATDVTTLAAGAELWLISAATLFGWLRTNEKKRFLTSAYVVTLLAALFALSFYFSYMYNMGLMVRQRVMAFPLLIPLAIMPALFAVKRSVILKRSHRQPIPQRNLRVPRAVRVSR